MQSSQNELFEIEIIHDHGIILSDNTRLSAKIWRPKNLDTGTFPTILEYIPYRKTDGTHERDALTHPYFAQRGYVCIRVDLRGNGDSEGLLFDEYTKQELDDAEEIINWVSRQEWSNGNLGMMGISWGGFNSLQVAARNPKPLKAIITLCSTVDRYADDIHFKGGCLLNENLGWGATMLAYSSRPPDPEFFPNTWKEIWLERLKNQPHLPGIWLEHQSRDEYWKHGSVCEDYSKIKAATLAIGGWGDAYKNAVPKLLENLSCPKKGIIGPWVHKYPHFAVPEPRIGFLQEALRWWDRWLKNIRNGAENDPDCRFYVMEGIPPKTSYNYRPGKWIVEDKWTSKKINELKYYFGSQNTLLLKDKDEANPSLGVVNSPQTCGLNSGEYCAIWLGPEWPGDQRGDDSLSVCFDTEEMNMEDDIVGSPMVDLKIKVNKPFGQLAVRLCDVSPTGSSHRITYGILSLKFSKGMIKPNPLPLKSEIEIQIELDYIAYSLPNGHKLRVSISNAYWPLIWPEPDPAEVEICGGTLSLPVRRQSKNEWVFPEPVSSTPWKYQNIRKSSNRREIISDCATGLTKVVIEDDFGSKMDLESNLIISSKAREEWSIQPENPLSALGKTHWTEERSRGDWAIKTETYSKMFSDETYFYLEARIEAYENNNMIYQRDISKKIKRLL